MKAELIKKDNFLQLILDNIPIYVFWKDKESSYLGCNKNFAVSAGVGTPDGIVGKSDYDLPWSKEDADFYRKIDKEVMDSGEAQINFEEPQTIDGNIVKWLRTSKIPLFDNDGEVIGILGTYEDITVRKKMELTLKQQAEELISKNENLKTVNHQLEELSIDIEQFTYATSHDLQEPLRMIGSFTDLLEKRCSDQLDKRGVEYVNFIKEGALRMSSLMDDTLSYSKLNRNKEEFEMVDIKELFGETRKRLEPLVSNSGIKLEANLPSEKIKCQRGRMIILFNKLISNSIKFNTSRIPTISIDFQKKETEWLFTVADNGIGIERTYSDYIFEPFKRLNNRKEFPGNGVGLSIAKRIVNLHGGKIWFEKNNGEGTIFYFTIKK